MPGLKPGAYRVIYTTVDDYGATFTTSRDFIVAGQRQTEVALPALLIAERSTVGVGETARLLVRSGLKNQTMVLETYRDGRRISRRVLHSGYDDELIELPIAESDRGGFSVVLTALRDHQLMRQTATIFVPWDDRRLDVSFATFRDTMRPGTRETFRVTVTGPQDTVVDAGTAELLAYMYDRSLDIFAPHTPPSPISLYPSRTAIGQLQSTLGAARQAWNWSQGFADVPGYPYLATDRLITLDGYGIGGMGVRYHMAGKGDFLAAQRMPSSVAATEAVVGDAREEDRVALKKEAADTPAERCGRRRRGAERGLLGDRLLRAPSAAGRRRLGDGGVRGAGLGDRVEPVGPCRHQRPQVGVDGAAGTVGQGAHGAAVPAALPPRGRPCGGQSGGQQRR